MKIRRLHKKYRKAGSGNLSICSACQKGDHQLCEDGSYLFCACWREFHEESF